MPPEAQRLVAQVVAQADPQATVQPPDPAAPAPGSAVIGSRHALDEAASIRDQLAELAPRLFRLLDNHWQRFLSLPIEVFQEAGHPPQQALDEAIARYDSVAADPRYQQLAARPEFQTVLALLRHYRQLIGDQQQALALPPPPPAPPR